MVEVTPSIFRRFTSEEGTSLTEGLVVFPLIILTFSAFIEFTYAMYQWNQTVKAIQFGARKAAVLDPIVENYDTLMEAGFPADQGGPVPSTVVTISCDGATLSGCNAPRMQNLVYGSGNASDSFLWRMGMSDFSPYIEIENVLVTYSRSGLGYVGRPDGVISTITVQVKDLSFNLPIMNALLGTQFNMPANPVSVSSEDLSSTN